MRDACCFFRESMKKHGRRLLVTVDEVVNNAGIRLFASMFQIMLRKDLPIFLLMTGLYENIRSLQDQKTLTFLYRAPRIALQPLNLSVMADSYQRIFEMEREEAIRMARETRGYSFAFQVLGYFTWQHPDDPSRIRQLYRQYLEEYVYEKKLVRNVKHRSKGGCRDDAGARWKHSGDSRAAGNGHQSVQPLSDAADSKGNC